jgi:hypothetical protein
MAEWYADFQKRVDPETGVILWDPENPPPLPPYIFMFATNPEEGE